MLLSHLLFCIAQLVSQPTETQAAQLLELTSMAPRELPDFLKAKLEGFEMPSLWSPSQRALIAKHEVENPKARILLVAHMDHFTIEGAQPSIIVSPTDGLIVEGPGAWDDKSGILQLFEVLSTLRSMPLWQQLDVRVFISADGASSDLAKRRSDRALIDFATEKPVDLAMVLEPGMIEGEGHKARFAIPSEIDGHYKLRITLMSPETPIGESKYGAGGAIDALTHVLNKFQGWRREGRSVLIYWIRSEGGHSTISAPSASASLSFRFADADFQSELAEFLDEIRDDVLKTRGVKIETARDRLLWSPQSVLSKPEMNIVESTLQDLGLPRPTFVRGLDRGAETILHNHKVPSIGSLGPLGKHARTDREYAIVSSISPRVGFCVRMAERLVTQKVSP